MNKKKLSSNKAITFTFTNQQSLSPFTIINYSQGIQVINNQLRLQLSQPGSGGPTLAYSQYMGQGGLWEINMQVAPKSGVITAFSIYGNEINAPSSGLKPDELDYEFTGNQPTIAQSMYFVKGQRVPGDSVQVEITTPDNQNLSSTTHTYGIEYNTQYINWYLDGNIKRTIIQGQKPEFPSSVGALRFGLWDGGQVSAWAGAIDYSQGPFNAYINWIRFTPYS